MFMPSLGVCKMADPENVGGCVSFSGGSANLTDTTLNYKRNLTKYDHRHLSMQNKNNSGSKRKERGEGQK